MKKRGDKTKKNHTTADETSVRELYHLMLDYWNFRNGKDIGSLFEKEGSLIGFDGSEVNKKKEIEKHLADIFKNHMTDPFVGLIKSVRFITSTVVLLRAHAGMVPRGQEKGKEDINPAVNTIHTLIAVKDDGDWYISLFQNTPAQFHGQPEKSHAFSEELRKLLNLPPTR